MKEKRYIRKADVIERNVDDAAFLAKPNDESLYHLNPLGKALWMLLAESITVNEAMGVILDAFPDMDGKEIKKDVSALISNLEENGLVKIIKN